MTRSQTEEAESDRIAENKAPVLTMQGDGMKEYELIREIMNACSGKWKIDIHFKDEWEAESPEALIASFYGGVMPAYDLWEPEEGSWVYTIEETLREKYTVTEIK